MSTAALDPMIHHPGRLRILAALAALPDGDTLAITRLQNMIGLPEGSPITHVCELSQAGYLRIEKTGGDAAPATTALTRDGRAALARYAAALRQRAHPARDDHQPPAPTCAPAMPTGTLPSRPWVSTSCKAG